MISLEKQLRELNGFDSRGLNMLSLYLHTDPLVYSPREVVAQMDRLVNALVAGMDPATHDAVLLEAASVRDYLTSLIAPPAGLAIFSCEPRQFFRIVRLPMDVPPSAFWSPWAHIVPLLEVCDRIEAVV